MQRDTTGDGLFDTTYHFEKGKLIHSTKDIDGDGRPNVWTSYRDDKPIEWCTGQGTQIDSAF